MLNGQNGQSTPPVVSHAVVASKYPRVSVVVAIPAKGGASAACLVEARIAQLGRAGLHTENAPLHAVKERNQEGELAKTGMIALVRKLKRLFVSFLNVAQFIASGQPGQSSVMFTLFILFELIYYLKKFSPHNSVLKHVILVSNLVQGHAKVESVRVFFRRQLNALKVSVLGGMIGKLGARVRPLVEVECITDSVNVSAEVAKECPWPTSPVI